MGLTPLIAPLDLATFDLQPDPPYFLPTFRPQLTELDAIDTALAALGDVSIGLDIAGILTSLDAPLAGVEGALGIVAGDSGATEIGSIVGSSSAIDAGLSLSQGALAAATAKGISIAVPVVPIHGITVTPPSAVVQPTPTLPPVGSSGGVGPPAASVHLQFTNVTRPGSPGRVRVGETFRLDFTGPAGTAIYVIADHNGHNNGQAGFGTIPPSGALTVTGSFGAGDRGTWIENWYAQGNYIGQVAFTVE